MANYKVHDNPIRDEWVAKLGKVTSVKAATQFIQDFRKAHTTPLRTEHTLDLDYLWIESKIEEKLAVLRGDAFVDEDLLNLCTTGEAAGMVVKHWAQKMEKATDKYSAEKLLIQFRQLYKPPVMPVNYFFTADTQMGSRLMELRNTNYYATSLPDLRKERGVKVLHLGVSKAAH
jgi:methane monooxygenase component A gamma chain